MPRIVIDAREYPTSTGRYIRKLLAYLEKIDANTDREYVVMMYSKDFTEYQPQAKNFSKVKANFKEFTFSEQFGFLRLIRNLNADLVHFTLVQQPVLYPGKVVTTIQDYSALRFVNPLKNIIYFRVKQVAYAFVNFVVPWKSKHLITPTETVKNELLHFAHIKPSKITVTLEAADKITAQAQEFPGLKNKRFLMYVGRALPHKNLEKLVDAFGILKQQYPELHLVFIGRKDPLVERHVTYAKSKGIQNVIATGYVSEGQLRWLYENTACYCFPSLSEGFGLPPLEAMMHGAPVACSNASCLPEVNGDAAHYFDPNDVQDMASKINDVISNQTLRDELVNKGADQVKKYSWQRMAEQTLEVYKKALTTR